MADESSCGHITEHAPDSSKIVGRGMPDIRASENNLKPLLEASGLSV